MNMSTFLFFAIFAILIGVIRFVSSWFSEAKELRRALTDARRVDVQSAKEGDVAKVVGRVESIGPLLTSPLGGRPCVLYDVLVEQYWSNGRGGGGPWVTLVRETKGTDFVLHDGTGHARVRTEAVHRSERRQCEDLL